jgi:hypothetical protein
LHGFVVIKFDLRKSHYTLFGSLCGKKVFIGAVFWEHSDRDNALTLGGYLDRTVYYRALPYSSQ